MSGHSCRKQPAPTAGRVTTVGSEWVPRRFRKDAPEWGLVDVPWWGFFVMLGTCLVGGVGVLLISTFRGSPVARLLVVLLCVGVIRWTLWMAPRVARHSKDSDDEPDGHG
jgi:hypothetical protein